MAEALSTNHASTQAVACAPSQGERWRRAARDGLVSGTSASLVSALAIAICSKVEQDSAAAGLNGPSQWVWGRIAAYRRDATIKHTLVGYVIHHAASVLWATLHERVFASHLSLKPAARHCVAAALTAATAYTIDYSVTPRRLRPGFKKHLGSWSLLAVYAGFALGLAAATLGRDAASKFNR